MTRVPDFDQCLVCDLVRPEPDGKVMLLGFFGACPNVEIGIRDMERPTALTFLFLGGPADEPFTASFDVVDEDGDRVIAASVPVPCPAAPGARTNLAPMLLVVFGHPGRFAARCLVDGVERFRGQFRVIYSRGPVQPLTT